MVPVASHYLGPKASVVKAPDFESGFVKVLSGKEKKLIQAEQRASSRLLCFEAHPTNSSSTAKLSFANRLLQSDSKTASPFIDLRWIPSTSNDVERLFLTAGLVLTDRRHRMHPTTLETLILLEFNRKL
ncbi:hypothetical protein PC120_g20187 [Phytophthora cactorum]|nr:hypothetical protein PC120_g20187 [Phytophthora cactorum]